MGRKTDAAGALVYQGIWKVLVDWFVVPAGPPELPVRPGDHLERFKPSPGFVRYLKFWFWLALFVVDGILLAAWIASFFLSVWLGVGLAPVFFAVAVLPDIVVFVAIHLRYDTTWYVLTNRSMRIRRGIWMIRETTITFENVQDITVRQGPVQRFFGISDVVVETAGGGGKQKGQEGPGQMDSHVGLLEGVSDPGRIRDLIMDRVRRSRHAGLGDEAPVSARDLHAPAGWSAAHLAALREIRSGLAALRTNFLPGARGGPADPGKAVHG